VALYKQTFSRGITAAGTVPDSHRIPFRRGDISHQIAYLAANIRRSEEKTKFFLTKVPKKAAWIVSKRLSCYLLPVQPFFLLFDGELVSTIV
jgi:hypothetical protein